MKHISYFDRISKKINKDILVDEDAYFGVMGEIYDAYENGNIDSFDKGTLLTLLDYAYMSFQNC